MKKIHLADIAKQTGYSLATVSKVLNGRSDVAESTRAIINDALVHNGYRKPLNSSTATNRYQQIEVVFQTFDTLWSLEILRGILKAASDAGVGVLVTESGDRTHPAPTWINDVVKRHPMGVILIFSDLTDDERNKLSQYHIRCVTLDPSGSPMPENYSVQADNWTGGVIATRHLLSLGHTMIGIITGPHAMMCSKARLNGYNAALEERGLTLNPSLVREGDFTTSGGFTQAMSLLSMPEHQRPTAIFGGSDLQSMGVYEAARRLHIRIPEDLSVIGFDDIQTAAYMGPALTTIRQPFQDMASAAVSMLLGAQDGQKTSHNIVFPTTLIVRDSVRQCRHRN